MPLAGNGEGTVCGSQVFGAVTYDGASRVSGDAAEVADRVTGVINGLLYDRAVMEQALREAERFMSYFAGETGGSFVGQGTPTTCLAKIRAALPAPASTE